MRRSSQVPEGPSQDGAAGPSCIEAWPPCLADRTREHTAASPALLEARVAMCTCMVAGRPDRLAVYRAKGTPAAASQQALSCPRPAERALQATEASFPSSAVGVSRPRSPCRGSAPCEAALLGVCGCAAARGSAGSAAGARGEARERRSGGQDPADVVCLARVSKVYNAATTHISRFYERRPQGISRSEDHSSLCKPHTRQARVQALGESVRESVLA